MTDTPQFRLVESYSSEFESQLRRINAFVKHPSAIGSSHEGILRRFLQKYMPQKFAVSEGFILDENNRPSNQCDIIIWLHSSYAPYYVEGDFVIIPSSAARVVIEVKTSLDKDAIVNSFQNLHSVRSSGSHIYTALFAFETVKLRTVVETMISTIDLDVSNSVNSIYGMRGWLLQLSRDIPLGEPGQGVFVETRQKILQQLHEPLALSVILPPETRPQAHGLSEFLGHIYTNLGMQNMEIPFHIVPGSLQNGYLFPGRGIQLFSDVLTEKSPALNDPRDGLIAGALLEEFLQSIEQRMNTIDQ